MAAIALKTEVPGPRSRELMRRREAAVPRGPANVRPSSCGRPTGRC